MEIMWTDHQSFWHHNFDNVPQPCRVDAVGKIIIEFSLNFELDFERLEFYVKQIRCSW